MAVSSPWRSMWLRRGLMLYAIAIAAIGWAYQWYLIQSDRETTIAQARSQLTIIAAALDNHVRAMIYDGVGAANAAANELSPTEGETQVSVDETRATLRHMLTGGDYVKALFIASPDLYVLAARPASGIEDAHVDWLLPELLQVADRTAWVGHPRVQAQGATAILPIARRITTPRGRHIWVGALFGIESLERLYRDVFVSGGAVALISYEGEMLLRVPDLPAGTVIGRRVADSAVFKRAFEGRPATLIGANPLDGQPWMFAGQRLDDYRVLVVASRNMDAVLADWRQRTRSALEIATAATLALLLLTAALHSVLYRRYEALRRSEERFELAIAGTSEGIWDWYIDRGYVFYSPRFRELLGYEANDPFVPAPETFWQHLHPADLERTQLAVQRHLQEREPYDVECRLRSKAGSHRWFRTRAQALWREGTPTRMVGAISDIDEQKRAQEALELAQQRELQAREDFSQRLLDAQDQERKRIANELHDSLGQNLSLIANRAQLALLRLPESGAREHVDAIVHVTAEAIGEVRALAHNLQPLHIEQTGLTEALKALVEQVASASAMRIDSHIEDVDDAFSTAHATHLYRIVQEACNNIMKHAQATQVHVALERDVHSVRLRLIDDGRGFALADERAQASGLGIASMLERAHILGGTLRVTSQPGAGCEVLVDVPVLLAESELSEESPAIHPLAGTSA